MSSIIGDGSFTDWLGNLSISKLFFWLKGIFFKLIIVSQFIYSDFTSNIEHKILDWNNKNEQKSSNQDNFFE